MGKQKIVYFSKLRIADDKNLHYSFDCNEEEAPTEGEDEEDVNGNEGEDDDDG